MYFYIVMFKRTGWNLIVNFLIYALVIGYYDCSTDVTYSGRHFVSEGSPFTISCFRSSYGVPKWTRNGLAVDSPDYQMQEETLANGERVRMDLRVEGAAWKHRGHYKCDPMATLAHDIEIVPSKESDKEIRQQSKVQLKPNRTLKLVCDQEENAVFPINWYKDGSRVLPSSSSSEEEDENPRVRMDGRTLLIRRATEEDAGEYTCVIEMAGLSYPFADHLGSRFKVTYAARVSSFPPQMRPILNRNLRLECITSGFPVPRVAWLVDGIPIEEFRMNNTRYDVTDNTAGLPDSVFLIREVQYEDNHRVTCMAENVDGEAATTTRLAVRESAIVTNEEEQGKGIVLNVGDDLVLQCNSTDNPSAKVTQWLKNGIQMNYNDTRTHKELDNTLTIKSTVESDCANYTCKVDNKEAVISVRSIVRLAPVDNSRNVVQNQNIVLLCNVTQGTPTPTLQWLKDEEPLNMSNPRVSVKTDPRGIEGIELMIKDAQFEDRAEYTCVATNEISSANNTILVRVKDKYAALWPFLGICAEVAVLCTIIFIYEKRRQKPDFDESETEHNTENKAVADQEDKSRDVRQRK